MTISFPARWAIWSVARPRWIVYALISEAAAVGVTVAGLADGLDNRSDLVWFTILLAMGVTQAEMWRHMEHMRRRMGGQTHVNVTSVWCLAGVLLLSPGWAALLATALYAHLWIRVWRHVTIRPAHRIAASTAWAMLSCWAAATVLHATGLGGLAGTPPGAARVAIVVLVAAVVFELVNLAVVVASIYLYTQRRSLTDLVGTPGDNALEVITLCLGGLTASALVHHPVLVALTFPPLLLLHRHVLVKHLEVVVATDEKTGLINNASWHQLADRELHRAETASATLAIFMIDIDYFKNVNDTYGHLAGDAVLRAVATTITKAVRDNDFVGRFGGEEFVVLLPGIPHSDVGDVAERVRHAVSQLTVDTDDGVIEGLSVSVGTAIYPTAGTSLERLVRAADTALLHAKRTGRNRVSHAAVDATAPLVR